jgi:glutamate 5-kinase
MSRRRLAEARRVVIKVGSSLIDSSPAGRPAQIADQVAALIADGREVVVVSSGAIALGMRALRMERRPTAVARLQAAAAVGQNKLLLHWQNGFAVHGLVVAQLLVTHDDLADRRRFINARWTLREVLDAGAVPVINENDTVATEEIKYGDNDRLATLVCNLTGAHALIILTDVDGVLDAPPELGGQRISEVGESGELAAAIGGPGGSGLGSGGMASKIQAARSAARHGVVTAIANGATPGVITALLAGEDVGTAFVPSGDRIRSRKHWIAYSGRPTGAIVVDAGARTALTTAGRSLLPAGVLRVQGRFEMGDPVSLLDEDGTEFARGLAAYSAEDVARIAGLQSADIEPTLGYKYLDEVVHRDDLVLLQI